MQSSPQAPLRDTLALSAWVVAGTALATLTATLWTGASPLQRALGSDLGEADNHLWMLWRAGRSLLGEDGPWANLPAGLSIPLMDPVNLPPYLVGALLDPVLGWNLLATFCVGLALFGGWTLGREVGGATVEGRGVALVTMVATGSAPFLAGVIDFGITESWGIGWMALHAATLLRFGREGRSRTALLAGLTLAAVALSGWYHALFGLVIEPFLVVWALSRAGRRGGRARLLGIGLQGGLALILTVPFALSLRDRQALWGARWHALSPAPPPPRADWHRLPIGGTDLLNLFLPSADTVDPSKTAYLGLVVVLLGLLGLILRPRRAGPALLVASPLLLLALGPWPSVAGHALGPPGLAWALTTAVPALEGISHWVRAVGAAVPFVALSAGLGAAALFRGRGLWLVCALILLDGLLFSQTPWPRPTHPVDMPQVLQLAAERAVEGEPRGVIQLPFDNGREMFSAEPARLYDRWQVRHGLPRAESYESADFLLAHSALVAGWQAATGLPTRLPPEQRPPRVMRDLEPLADPAAIAADLGRLRGWGYRFVVLHTARAPDADAAQAAVEAALGPGEAVGADVLWTLPGEGGAATGLWLWVPPRAVDGP